MELKFEIGQNEKTELIIQRNWFTGKFIYIENGVVHKLQNLLDIKTYVDLDFTNLYVFEVGNTEKHKVELTHSREIAFGAFRPQHYEVKIDGELVENYTGY